MVATPQRFAHTDFMIKNIFSNHFLAAAAMPQLHDLACTQSITYLSGHDAKVALGIIINKPL